MSMMSRFPACRALSLAGAAGPGSRASLPKGGALFRMDEVTYDGGSTRITKQEIAEGLRSLGIRRGNRLIVHSSLSSFGYVAGGARTVIAALTDVLTADGLLMMPSFNHFSAFKPGAPGYYDPASTPTTNGLIPETFRRMPGVMRSLNPTHAFAAWGTDARRYLERHHLTLTMGADSPLGLLCSDGGCCLLLGVDYRSNTFKHVVETIVGSPCVGRRTIELPVILPDGRKVGLRTWRYRESRCPIQEPNELFFSEMDRRGLHRVARIGTCRCIYFRLSDALALDRELLTQGTMNCPPCSKCPIRPESQLPYVESDWNDERSELRVDSPSRAVGALAWEAPAGE